MVSVGISKLSLTDLIFVDPEVKSTAAITATARHAHVAAAVACDA